MSRPWKPVLWFKHEEAGPGLDRVSTVYGAGPASKAGTVLFERAFSYRISWDPAKDAWRLDVRAAAPGDH